MKKMKDLIEDLLGNRPFRRTAAILWGAMWFGVVSWGIYSGLHESRIDVQTMYPLPTLDPVSYSLVFDSVDPSSEKLQAHAEVVFNRNSFLTSPEAAGEFIAMSDAKVSFGPMVLRDLGDDYKTAGLPNAQNEMRIVDNENEILGGDIQLSDLEKKPAAGATPNVPQTVQQGLTMVGDPRKYPFDRYLVMGKISCAAFAFAPKSHKHIRMPGDSYRADFRIPGFTFRDATYEDLDRGQRTQLENDRAGLELLRHGGVVSDADFKAMEVHLDQTYDPNLWARGGFAYVLRRPWSLRFFAIFLGGAALLSIVCILFTKHPREVLWEAVGTFGGVWGIRQALVLDAPHTTTYVDYGALTLYAFLVVAVTGRFIWGFKDRKP